MLRFLTVVLFLISLSLKGTVWTDCRQEFETAAEALHKDGKDPATTAKQARIIGDTVAFLAGRDVTFAGKTGTYEELKKLTRGYGHYIEAHEIPSWAALKHNGSTKPRVENTAIIILRKDHIRPLAKVKNAKNFMGKRFC